MLINTCAGRNWVYHSLQDIQTTNFARVYHNPELAQARPDLRSAIAGLPSALENDRRPEDILVNVNMELCMQ